MKPEIDQEKNYWHSLKINDLLDNLKSSPKGLSSIQADKRLKEIGLNTLKATTREPFSRKYRYGIYKYPAIVLAFLKFISIILEN